MTDRTTGNDFYIENVGRLEPNLSTVWGQVGNAESAQATALISVAISLKRVADALECYRPLRENERADLGEILFQHFMGSGVSYKSRNLPAFMEHAGFRIMVRK